MRYRAALAGAALAVAAAGFVPAGPAAAVEPGFQVRITELPATFGAGAESRTLTVVVSSDRARCIKVRWSLLLQADGPDLDEVEVTRIESDGEFGVRREEQDDIARITDRDVDPGQLCRGRTVTATYRISVDEDADTGRIAYRPQAFDARNTLLQETTGESQVVGQDAGEDESPSPSPSPSPSESEEPEEEAAATSEPEASDTPGEIDAVPAASSGGPPSLLGPGLIVGAVLVLAGIALLLRLRLRNQEAARRAAMPPTGFYPTR